MDFRYIPAKKKHRATQSVEMLDLSVGFDPGTHFIILGRNIKIPLKLQQVKRLLSEYYVTWVIE